MFGRTVGNVPGVVVFDRDVRLLTSVGDEGVLLNPRYGHRSLTLGVLPYSDGMTLLTIYRDPMSNHVTEMFRLRV